MHPLVMHDPVVAILIVGSVALWFFVEAVLRGRFRSETRTAPEWSYFLLTFALLGGSAISTVAAAYNLAPLPGGVWWPVIAGVALIWIGSALRVWSIVVLGRYFKLMVVVQENHQVIDRGPYRWLRHPSYLGGIMLMAGIGLAEGGWVSTMVMLFAGIAAFVVRLRFEERVLVETLGEEYSAYIRRTARLLPGVY
jgi:protein-S-isoprenylcysteine O-methyltransferase Ste14